MTWAQVLGPGPGPGPGPGHGPGHGPRTWARTLAQAWAQVLALLLVLLIGYCWAIAGRLLVSPGPNLLVTGGAKPLHVFAKQFQPLPIYPAHSFGPGPFLGSQVDPFLS